MYEIGFDNVSNSISDEDEDDGEDDEVLDEDESDGIYEEEEEFGEYPPGKTSDPFQLSFWGAKLIQGGMFEQLELKPNLCIQPPLNINHLSTTASLNPAQLI